MVQRVVVTAAMAFLATACGSDSGLPPSPPTAGSTITISSSGVSPKSLLVSPGTQVTFTNNDSREHEMTSDPHPEHTDCPAINTVDLVVPGQSKQTSNLNAVRTCGYHDHRNPENAALRGTITIQ
jgi:plastocyanin